MIFLMEATIGKYTYMDQEEKFQHRTVILADSYDEAVEKYTRYWEKQNSEYSVTYTVYDYTLNEGIQ